MNIETLEQYAPYIIMVLLFFIQNNIFTRPEQLEKKHREILDDIKKNFVELNAYKEFQNHVLKEFEDIKNDMSKGFDDSNKNFDEIKGMLMLRRREDKWIYLKMVLI